MNYKDILSQAESLSDYTVSLRRHFHAPPELSRAEFATRSKIIEELTRFGIDCAPIAGTGVIAAIRGEGEGRTLVLRADIDALPITEENTVPYKSRNDGVMHACGHDMHAASLVAAARMINLRRDGFSGTAYLVFQPGEEDGYGGVLCAADERVRSADRVFGIHVAPDLEVGRIAAVPGAIMASVDMYRIEIEGRQSHISRPHLGVDAALIAAEILTSVKAIQAGMTNPWDAVLVGIGSIHAGTSYNILAGSAYLEGTVRAFSEESRERAKRALENIVHLTAEKYGGSARVVYDGPSPAVVNDREFTERVQRVASELLGDDKVVTEREKSYGGDDFSFFQTAAPGTYAIVGSGDPGNPATCVPVHNSHFDADERALTAASALYTAVAMDYLGKK